MHPRHQTRALIGSHGAIGVARPTLALIPFLSALLAVLGSCAGPTFEPPSLGRGPPEAVVEADWDDLRAALSAASGRNGVAVISDRAETDSVTFHLATIRGGDGRLEARRIGPGARTTGRASGCGACGFFVRGVAAPISTNTRPPSTLTG